eukprot:scaffold1696_cov258-Pinguiococcus_pyrenoidosus.AAC.41
MDLRQIPHVVAAQRPVLRLHRLPQPAPRLVLSPLRLRVERQVQRRVERRRRRGIDAFGRRQLLQHCRCRLPPEHVVDQPHVGPAVPLRLQHSRLRGAEVRRAPLARGQQVPDALLGVAGVQLGVPLELRSGVVEAVQVVQRQPPLPQHVGVGRIELDRLVEVRHALLHPTPLEALHPPLHQHARVVSRIGLQGPGHRRQGRGEASAGGGDSGAQQERPSAQQAQQLRPPTEPPPPHRRRRHDELRGPTCSCRRRLLTPDAAVRLSRGGRRGLCHVAERADERQQQRVPHLGHRRRRPGGRGPRDAAGAPPRGPALPVERQRRPTPQSTPPGERRQRSVDLGAPAGGGAGGVGRCCGPRGGGRGAAARAVRAGRQRQEGGGVRGQHGGGGGVGPGAAAAAERAPGGLLREAAAADGGAGRHAAVREAKDGRPRTDASLLLSASEAQALCGRA